MGLKNLPALLLALVALSSCSPDWRAAVSQDGSFSVDLPKNPEQNARSADGRGQGYVMSVSLGTSLLDGLTGRTLSLLAGYVRLQVGLSPQERLARGREVVTQLLPSVAVRRVDLPPALYGYPAEEHEGTDPGNTGVRARLIVTPDRCFQLVVIGTPSDMHGAIAERFLGSFKLRGERPGSPAGR